MAKKAVLCVDDEVIIVLALLQELGKHFGERFVYERAKNADTAFRIIEELEAEGVSVEVVISDLLMPGMKGDEFLVAVKRRYPHTRTVLITGQANKAAIRNPPDASEAFLVVSKPWTADALIRAVEGGPAPAPDART